MSRVSSSTSHPRGMFSGIIPIELLDEMELKQGRVTVDGGDHVT
jgi:hypothetical protein